MSKVKDFYLLFITRSCRLFSYGSLAVVLFLYLAEIGLDQQQIGLLLTCILVGDLVITMFLTTHADRVGRKKTLALGALLKLFTGIMFATTQNLYLLVFSGIVGVISTTGGQIGPFLAIQQAALTDLKEDISHGEIATLFGWYNLFGYLSQALGSLFGGGMIWILTTRFGYTNVQAYRMIIFSYAFWGFVKWILYNQLSDNIECASFRVYKPSNEPQKKQKTLMFGLKRQKTLKIIIELSLLFSLDAFAGGLVMQSFFSYWFSKKWNINIEQLGAVLMVTNIISGLSGLVASRLVNMIGAVQTMVVTHLPSNVLLMMIPLMSSAWGSVLMLFGRSSISQMDVPARQAYVAMVVDSDQRSAAGGITNIARSMGLSTAPLILGSLIKAPIQSWKFSSPFIIAGLLKIIYDIAVCMCYWTRKAPAPSIKQQAEEQKSLAARPDPLLRQIEEAINDEDGQQSAS